MCSLSVDLHHRDAAYRLYRCIWGGGLPPYVTDAQRAASEALQRHFYSRHKSADERTWQRIARAKEYVRQLREPREFPMPSASARNNNANRAAGGSGANKKQKKGHQAQQQQQATQEMEVDDMMLVEY